LAHYGVQLGLFAPEGDAAHTRLRDTTTRVENVEVGHFRLDINRVPAVTANSTGPVVIDHITETAKPFWDKIGVYDYDGQNAKLD
jgi:hypothetical protein